MLTPYIPEHGVASVLGWVARAAAPGSSIVFDYAYREAVDGSAFFYGAPQLRRRVAETGEPLRFGLGRDVWPSSSPSEGSSSSRTSARTNWSGAISCGGSGSPAGHTGSSRSHTLGCLLLHYRSLEQRMNLVATREERGAHLRIARPGLAERLNGALDSGSSC